MKKLSTIKDKRKSRVIRPVLDSPSKIQFVINVMDAYLSLLATAYHAKLKKTLKLEKDFVINVQRNYIMMMQSIVLDVNLNA